ncbi:hypothetical protein Xind_03428 [Xenorhabdus indica]|nr:hypothetical protein [Xenorhabdus indica]
MSCEFQDVAKKLQLERRAGITGMLFYGNYIEHFHGWEKCMVQ